MIQVQLTPIEVEFCDWLGAARQAKRERAGSVHRNNRRVTDAEALAGHRLGVRTECAGKTYLWMTTWHIELLDDVADVPDLEHPRAKIDVKGITLHSHGLISPSASIHPDWVYLLISAQEHPRYLICGWCRGSVLAEAPVRELRARRPCRVIDRGSPLLRDPVELYGMLA
jgi:hypothetical protein